MSHKISKEEYKKLNSKYGLNEEICNKLSELKSVLSKERNMIVSYDELIIYLKSAMNHNDMQIWLVRNKIKGHEISLNEMLTKFFELNTYNDFLVLFDIDQNCNQTNIDDVRSTINDYEKEYVMRLIKK